ncbi:MAG: segregation/condensation protein A [Chloroflexi bacterium]|nr:segregation/condensation protein A [Chloroflexota bacterium]
MTYQLRLPTFEGPLDLLLQLVERRQLDVSTVSLAAVTEQYIEHLASLEPLDLDAWSGFLVVAARLLLLKSRSLLPQPPVEVAAGPEAADDLVRQLAEHCRFRPVVAFLRAREESGLRSYPRVVPAPAPSPPALLPGTPADLLAAYRRALARREPPPTIIRPAAISVAEQVERIAAALAAGRTLTFSELLAETPGRAGAVAGFLAVLDLVRRGSAAVEQAETFGEIVVRPVEAVGAATRVAHPASST